MQGSQIGDRLIFHKTSLSMKYLHLFILTLISLVATAQQAPVPVITLKYDTSALRIPGNAFTIGLIANDNGKITSTKGLLKGKDGWRKYDINVTGGSFSAGKIKIAKDKTYKKGDSLKVDIYKRKWFLGGKGALLATAYVPYNYETGIKILTKGTFSKAPGNHVQFGIRTFYDDKKYIDKWAPANQNLQDFVLAPNGSHISKSKGDLKIENNPLKISNDKAVLVAELAKQPAIRDTLQIVLDYAAPYKFNATSFRRGHDIIVNASTYYDTIINATLMRIYVADSAAKRYLVYQINTVGGSLAVTTKGANGYAGSNGFDGSTGSNGSDGMTYTTTQTVTNADGTTSTETSTSQGPGGNGQNGGNGGDGGNGGNGFDGGNITINYSAPAKPYLGLITAKSIPGTGGPGGIGGRGGWGGSGGSGSPSGSSGFKGSDGANGSSGADGKPGKIVYKLAQ